MKTERFLQVALLSLASFAVPFFDSNADDLQAVLGSPTNEWRIGHVQGTTNDYHVRSVDGTPALSAGPNAVIVTSLKPLPVTPRPRCVFGARLLGIYHSNLGHPKG